MNPRSMNVSEVREGDIVIFKSYMLRIEAEPAAEGNGFRFRGRKSTGGSPMVDKWFMKGTELQVIRYDPLKIIR